MRSIAISIISFGLAGCGGSGSKAKPAEPPERPPCMLSVALPHGTSVAHGESQAKEYDAAHAQAKSDVDRANELATKQDLAGAAVHYLACARRFSAVPDGAGLRDYAQDSAKLCIQAAAGAFGGQGKLATEGKAALEALAKQDPRVDADVGDALANPPCGEPVALEGVAYVGSCLPAGALGLYVTVAPSHRPFSDEFARAESAAHADAERGSEALAKDDHAGAASHFLSCAQQYSKVPDEDPQRAHAMKNAEICYRNAAQSYGSAGQFATIGRAKLEASAQSDPRMKPVIDAILAKPPLDCKAN